MLDVELDNLIATLQKIKTDNPGMKFVNVYIAHPDGSGVNEHLGLMVTGINMESVDLPLAYITSDSDFNAKVKTYENTAL